MCLCCFFCGSSRCCTTITAILTMIEAFLYACLNLTLILGYKCKIEPPQKDHLASGFDFIEQCWSWFIYDEENCERNQGPDYKPPLWIEETPLPDYFNSSSILNAVTPYSNYCYQIIYFILHSMWFFSAIALLYGNARRNWWYFPPYIVVGSLIILLDTIVGSFYIKLMKDTNPGWEDGRAIFSMQFLYFRTFLIYILNIVAVIFILITCRSTYSKAKQLQKTVIKIMKENRDTEYRMNVVTTSTISKTSPIVNQAAKEVHSPPDKTSNFYEPLTSVRDPEASRYRPFSYTNPAYRPPDFHDIEGMKINGEESSPPITNIYPHDDNLVEGLERIPRASLKK